MLGRETWRSYDGKEMPWRAHGVTHGIPVRAVVITVHGLSGAASDFWMLDDTLPRRGIAVCGLELRGMGNDPDRRRRGDILAAEVWERDLFTFHSLVRARHPGVPVYWYGESVGSLIALHALADMMSDLGPEQRPAGLMFSSPVAGFKTKPGPLKHLAIRAAMVLMPRRKVSLEKLVGVKDADIQVTATTTHGSRMAVTPHHVPEFTFRLLRGILGMVRTNPAALRKVEEPLLVLATPNDVISSRRQVEAYFDAVPSADKSIRWYDESYHLLLHDVQRDEVLRDATAWLETRVAGKGLASSQGSR
jgi:alpha-beta hydrolase superfamily lysophospholipase